MNKVLSFFKKEILFTISLLVALLSFAFHLPSEDLLLGINWKTLILLFMLFTVLEGFKKERMLDLVTAKATRIRKPFLLSLFLILSIFILSTFITNDVSLLAFVPITIAIFKKTERKKYIMPVVVLETIAANLGSLLTPFGNPQNLFLYDKMGIIGTDFILMMLPIYIASLLLLVIALLFVFRHDLSDELVIKVDDIESMERNKGLMMFYLCLLLFVLIGVMDYINWITIFIFFMIMVVAFDRSVLKRVDYTLLATFLCFFIFSTNLSLNNSINEYLSRVVNGHEFISGLLLSQVISNVPTAILLEPFSNNLKGLLFGVDIGGLGTIVASLASLISFRIYTKEETTYKSRYLLSFAIWNALFLIILIPISLLLI